MKINDCEEVRRLLHQALVKMADYQWGTAQSIITKLYADLNKSEKHPSNDAWRV